METIISKKICLTTILFSLLLSLSCNAQIMWNIKGGIMPVSYRDGYDDNTTVDWMAGLEMEIPLSSKLNLETGLRYKHHNAFSINQYFGDYDEYYRSKSVSHLELPLRVTYKYPLNENFMLRAGMGPYASYSVGSEMGHDWNNSLVVGLEPAVAVDWKALSIGFSYNLPCFYKGYKDENNNSIMFTVGIRFGSDVWESIGNGIVRFDDAMRRSGTYDAIESMSSNAGTSIYQPTSSWNNETSPTSVSGSTNESSTNGNGYNLNEEHNYNTDKQTWSNYDSMLSQHFYGTLSATRNDVRQWQQKMKELRKKWETKGKGFPTSTNENRSTSDCLNSSHSH